MGEDNARASSKYIVCGRGQCKYNCEGNKVFRLIIARHLKDYMMFATRSKKSELIKRVTEELRNLGMIFMATTGNGMTLEELSPGEARKKVAHRFRDAARAAKQFDTHDMYSATGKTSFCHQASENNRLLSIDPPLLRNPESMNVERIMLIPESSETEDIQQTIRLTQSMMKNLHSPTESESEGIRKSTVAFDSDSRQSTDNISQKAMFTRRHTEIPVRHPEILFSLTSDENIEDIPSNNETYLQRENAADDFFDVFDVMDIFDIDDMSNNFDGCEAYNALSLLLGNTRNMLESY
jgi:hypothetical protein